jgi:hypothetical protein
MTGIKASIAGNLWRTVCEPARRRLSHSLLDPATAQHVVLQRILTTHAGCAYGATHGLRPGMRTEDFRNALPTVRYTDLEPWIERMKAGEPNLLHRGRPSAFERSSGSTSGSKWISFNDDLRCEFQEAVRAWMGDLYQRHPALTGGRAWWVVSPLAEPAAVTTGGIPVGLASDDEYLGRCEKRLASWLRITNTPNTNWQHGLEQTAEQLMSARDLRLISVWNPSYLLLLWEIIMQLRGGTADPREIWPHLTVISAWADAGAAADAGKVRALFPHATLQPKGLLATEGVITLPWRDDHAAAVPALHSHFFEFLEWPGGKCRLVHELEQGKPYEVLLTTGGGLWRYRLGDVVTVDGMAGNTPRLRLQGRADGVCDLRGEKLNPLFVAQIFTELTQGFSLLAPGSDGQHYIWFTKDADLTADVIDARLRENPYYHHAREIGQLNGVRKFLIADPSPERIYLDRCRELGQRGVTIKLTALHPLSKWDEWFHGKFVP